MLSLRTYLLLFDQYPTFASLRVQILPPPILVAHRLDMEGSRTPLHLWFQAIFLHSRPQSVNAVQLSKAIDVTYKTAWLICHKIRQAMSCTESDRLLSGIVRVSDTVYCKRLTPSFDWHDQEQPLLIASSIDDQGEPDFIVIQQQSKIKLKDKYDMPDPAPFIRSCVHPDHVSSTIITRRYGPKMFKKLAWMGYSITWWMGRLFRGIGPKHLQKYLNQFSYYHNKPSSRCYSELLSDCISSPRITYSELTKPDFRQNRSKDSTRISVRTTSVPA